MIPALPVIMGTGLSGSVMILLVKPIGIILLKSSGVILWAYDRLCSAAVMLPFGRNGQENQMRTITWSAYM